MRVEELVSRWVVRETVNLERWGICEQDEHLLWAAVLGWEIEAAWREGWLEAQMEERRKRAEMELSELMELPEGVLGETYAYSCPNTINIAVACKILYVF